MLARLVLTNDVNSLHKAICLDLTNKLRTNLLGFDVTLGTIFKDQFIKIIKSSDTYTSLLSGKLWTDFGIANPRGDLDNIIQFWCNEVSVKTTRPLTISTQGIDYEITISAINASFENVVNSKGAFYYSDNIKKDTHILIPWLRWLLIQGSDLIPEFIPKLVPNSSVSRTDGTIMVKKKGYVWQVDSGFAGTPGSNWITREIELHRDAIGTLMFTEFYKTISK